MPLKGYDDKAAIAISIMWDRVYEAILAFISHMYDKVENMNRMRSIWCKIFCGFLKLLSYFFIIRVKVGEVKIDSCMYVAMCYRDQHWDHCYLQLHTQICQNALPMLHYDLNVANNLLNADLKVSSCVTKKNNICFNWIKSQLLFLETNTWENWLNSQLVLKYCKLLF